MNEVKASNVDKGQNSGKNKRHGIQLFSPDPQKDMVSSQSNLDNRRRRWDEMSVTDDEGNKGNSRPWYEMSDDEESVVHAWKSDDEDNQSQVYRI